MAPAAMTDLHAEQRSLAGGNAMAKITVPF
jgi:hypothetical protein